MKEINQRSLISLIVFYVLIVGGYGIYDTFLKKSPNTVEQEVKDQQYAETMNEANAYVTVGDSQKAAQYYKEAEKIKPKDKQTLYHLVSSQMNAKQHVEAEKTFKKLESMDNSANFWYLRADNMSNILTNINNINAAVKYVDNAYEMTEHKDDLFLLSTRAKIYFEEYKYYRLKKSSKTTDVEAKFKAALKEFGEQSMKQHNHTRFLEQNYLYDCYRAFPDQPVPQSPFAGELQKIEYTQEDIERIKRDRPQDSFPSK